MEIPIRIGARRAVSGCLLAALALMAFCRCSGITLLMILRRLRVTLAGLFGLFSMPIGWAASGPGTTTFRVLTWNIHHGEGMDQRVDLERIAKLIQDQRADLVALQEVDKLVERTKRRDLPAELAKLTGLSVVFSNNYSFQGGEYGNAILSRFPIVSTTNLHYQKVNETEQRGLLQAIVNVNGRNLAFLDTHLDHRRPDDARWSNVSEIEKAVGTLDMPVVLCGDFDWAPEGRVYERLRKSFEDAWVLGGKNSGFAIPAENRAAGLTTSGCKKIPS